MKMEIIFKEVETHLKNNALKKLKKQEAVIIYIRGNKIDLSVDLKAKDKKSVLRILDKMCNIIFG